MGRILRTVCLSCLKRQDLRLLGYLLLAWLWHMVGSLRTQSSGRCCLAGMFPTGASESTSQFSPLSGLRYHFFSYYSEGLASDGVGGLIREPLWG